VTDGTGTQTGGSATAQTIAADGDPASSAGPYSTQPLTGVGSSLSTSGGSNSITFANAANDSGTVDAATSAAGSNVCPPAPATAEADSLPCGGSLVTQAGALSTTANIGSLSNPNVGAVTLAQVAGPTTTTTLANRNAVSGQDGLVQQTVSRTIGQMDIGGLPAWITTNC